MKRFWENIVRVMYRSGEFPHDPTAVVPTPKRQAFLEGQPPARHERHGLATRCRYRSLDSPRGAPNALEYEGKAAIGSVIGRIMAMRGDLRQHGKAVTGLVAQQVNAANAMAGEDGLDAVRSVLEAEAPHLLEKRETKARREGLPS